MFKLIREDSVLLVYCKQNETAKLIFFFNKELKSVDIEYQTFERSVDCHFVPQGENQHSCRYGYWQVQTPCLSIEDIEFLHKRTKALWGDSRAEKDDKA